MGAMWGNKRTCKEEQVTIDFAFATVCSIKTIKKGEVLSMENVWVKRPEQVQYLQSILIPFRKKAQEILKMMNN